MIRAAAERAWDAARIEGYQDAMRDALKGLGVPAANQETMSVDQFKAAWLPLTEQGKCDGYGGMECKRVFREWMEADYPDDLSEFIVSRANAMPGDFPPDLTPEQEHQLEG